jgi:adenylosuccinate synthase
MINGISWLVVTKLDVLDHLTEIPVCVGYKVDGKETDEVPAQASVTKRSSASTGRCRAGRARRHRFGRWKALPKAAREYMAFIEKETGARVGMISTGPDREQTILVPNL